MDLLEQEEVEAGILAANKKGEEERASEWLGWTPGLAAGFAAWYCCLVALLAAWPSAPGEGHGARPPLASLLSPSVLGAVSRINAAIRRGMPAETLEALMDPAAQLPAVYPLAAPLYQLQLALLQRQHPRVRAPGDALGVPSAAGASVPLLR